MVKLQYITGFTTARRLQSPAMRHRPHRRCSALSATHSQERMAKYRANHPAECQCARSADPFSGSDRRQRLLLFTSYAVDEHRKAAHAKRRTPPTYGNRAGVKIKANPKRQAGEKYTTMAYTHAIWRACRRVLFRLRVYPSKPWSNGGASTNGPQINCDTRQQPRLGQRRASRTRN